MNQQSMYRRPVRGADEFEAFGALHRDHSYRPGQSSRAAIKRRHNQRDRRSTRAALRSGRI